MGFLGRWIFVLLGLGVVVGVGAYLVMHNPLSREEIADVSTLKTQYPVVHYEGPDLPTRVTLTRSRPAQWVDLDEISKFAVGAVIVSEDYSYYHHPGYDWEEIKKAAQEDWEAKEFARGASTLTQQVAKNVFLTKEKSLWRKLKEFYIAVQLEKEVGKKKILATYLNIAEMGPGIYGVRAAAQYYFQKHPRDLSAREGAFLAMLLPSPIRYGESFRRKKLTDYARRTIDRILVKMERAHYLTLEELAAEQSALLAFEELNLPDVLSIPDPEVSAPEVSAEE